MRVTPRGSERLSIGAGALALPVCLQLVLGEGESHFTDKKTESLLH